ncbi:MAG: hypothetical protein FWC01_08740 [Treponema sp.]|nr:hypothetical protein [Treponema sp.]MCL2238043.1 hypothetical protein [Treponema sp.]
MMIEHAGLSEMNAQKLETLRQCINDDNYLHAAIQRLALIMSNELMGINSKGGRDEQRRKGRKS